MAPLWKPGSIKVAKRRKLDPMNRAYFACYHLSHELFVKIKKLFEMFAIVYSSNLLSVS